MKGEIEETTVKWNRNRSVPNDYDGDDAIKETIQDLYINKSSLIVPKIFANIVISDKYFSKNNDKNITAINSIKKEY